MDSSPEDMTMRTLIKGMIADEVAQSIVRQGRKSTLQKKASTPKKLINIPIQKSPTMVLRSQEKGRRSYSLRNNTTETAGSSKIHSTGKNSPAPKKAKTVEAIPPEAFDDYTPRNLLKKFMQTELESSLVKVVNPKMKTPMQKKPRPTKKLSSGSLPAEDATEEKLSSDRKVRKLKKISISEFEKARQQRLEHSAETQEHEQVELHEKSTRLPDISTIVGFVNPEFEESTTKPILCRRPLKRKVINEDDFEEGMLNYLEQEKEPEEIERSGPFEKTSGLTDISRIVGSINVDIDESVTKAVLSRRPKRDKFINEDDFEKGVLFYLQQAKEKSFPEGEDVSSDSTRKEKSSSHTQQDELAATELYTSPWPTKSNRVTAASPGTEEINELGLNAELDLEKEMELSVPAEEEAVKMASAGRANSHSLIQENNLKDTDHQMDYTAEKPTEDLQVHEESVNYGIQTEGGAKEHQSEHGGSELAVGIRYSKRAKVEDETAQDSEYQADYKELETARNVEQNLPTLDGQDSAALQHSERVDADELVLVHEMGDKAVETDDVNDGRMEVQSMEGDKVDDERTEGDEMEEKDDERVEEKDKDDERVEEEDDERVEEEDDERVEEEDDERVEEEDEREDERVEQEEDERVEQEEDERVEEEEDERVEEEEEDERVEQEEREDERVEQEEDDERVEQEENERVEEKEEDERVEQEDDDERVEQEDDDERVEQEMDEKVEEEERVEQEDDDERVEQEDDESVAEEDDERVVEEDGRVEEEEEDGWVEDEGVESGDERIEDDEDRDEVAEIDNSEYEDDSKVRPIFQQSAKVFKSSPLLTTPHFLKVLGSKAQKPLVKVKQNPKKLTPKQKKPILPRSFIKSVFTHYAKMRVKKETFAVVEHCLELYFKQLCDDLEAYCKHAKRRTIEKEDLELLMKRQGFVTDKTPLNVLIEKHLPMECREKLIPMAVSGSKIIPKK
ncbi:uncharacterized protein cenpt [Scyliorhinus torazame]|uniref:uncharacterized protein cenpt n=1 Tax=Scyliorhinus torazame TaxID=75743 RepID=UPI003B5A31EC